jgi:predicted DNA binding CopG/RHH family protein
MAETKQFNTRLPVSTIDALRDEAARRGVPQAQLIREGIDRILSDNAKSSVASE